MKETVLEKLKVLAESAKYDVSCASSGVTRKHRAGGVGSAAGWGICHSFTADGRCVSLLKIMLTNVCIYDCAYCINRRSNDIPRAAFTPGELAELTIEFYRRNYIEGLFLSSGVVRDPDYTMERMVRVARDLRTVHRFNGYLFNRLQVRSYFFRSRSRSLRISSLRIIVTAESCRRLSCCRAAFFSL